MAFLVACLYLKKDNKTHAAIFMTTILDIVSIKGCDLVIFFSLLL